MRCPALLAKPDHVVYTGGDLVPEQRQRPSDQLARAHRLRIDSLSTQTDVHRLWQPNLVGERGQIIASCPVGHRRNRLGLARGEFLIDGVEPDGAKVER